MKKWGWIFLGFLLFTVSAPPPLFAQETASSAELSDIISKLNKISDKQDKILAELEAIKSELNIVKIRTTLNS